MLPKEYSTISNLSGPLMVVEKIDDVRYDELAEIRLTNGERRRGRVLEITEDRALVQVYEGSSGIDTDTTKIRFLGDVLTLPVAKSMLGRIFNGRGAPMDGGAEIIPETFLDVNGNPMNPYSRDYPSEFIQNGDIDDRRDESSRERAEVADFLGQRYAAQQNGGTDRPPVQRDQWTRRFRRRLCRHGHHV